MFNWVHNNKRLIQVILGLMIVPFAFFGLESYQNLQSRTVAEVDGQPITEQEFSRELQEQQDRLRSMLGGNFDPSMLDTPEMRTELLEGMISQRLLTQEAVSRNMQVSDEELRQVIASLPPFQQDGKFSRALYEGYLRSRGQTAAMFENGLRRDLLLQQLSVPLAESGIVSKAIASRIAAFRSQEREVAQHIIRQDEFAARLEPSPEDIKTFYEANRVRFETPEQVRVEYVVLNADALAAKEPVPEQDVKAFYEQNLLRYGNPEQRQASHILFAFKPDATAEEKEKTRQEAARIAEQVKKAPGSFAALAKKHSDDPGSAAKGGDLGYFSRGMMVKPFEDAVFNMKSGEISDPVESEFGYHIIRVTGVRPSTTKPLQQVREEIEAELRKQVAGRRFAQAADTFSNLVYEQSGSLQPAAKEFNLRVQEAGWLTREKASAEPLQNPKLLEALFAEDAVKNRRNTQAVEVSPGTLVSARVVEHRPAAMQPLEEVRAEVRRQWIERESLELARKEGKARLAALQQGGAAKVDNVDFRPARMVSRQKPEGVQPQALTPIFRADASKLPAYVGVELPEGYGIYQVGKVVTPEPSQEEVNKLQAELGRFVGAQQFRAYVAALRADGDVEINREAVQPRRQ